MRAAGTGGERESAMRKRVVAADGSDSEAEELHPRDLAGVEAAL